MPAPAIVNATDPGAAAAAQQDTRPKYSFRIPHHLPGIESTDPKTITLRPLTLEQEVQGNRLFASSGDAWQKVGMALFAMDGKQLSWLSRDADVALAAMSPKCRDLVSEAYKAIHVANLKETDDFLSSRVLEI